MLIWHGRYALQAHLKTTKLESFYMPEIADIVFDLDAKVIHRDDSGAT